VKATLEFTLPEDAVEFRQASSAGDTMAALREFAEYLRGQHKHADPPDDVHAIRERFYSTLADYGVTLD